LEMLWIQ